MSKKKFRTVHDSMGELQVPEDALWGAQTQRAVDNFPISGLAMSRRFIGALGLVKWAAAGANAELGLLTSKKAMAASLKSMKRPSQSKTKIGLSASWMSVRYLRSLAWRASSERRRTLMPCWA